MAGSAAARDVSIAAGEEGEEKAMGSVAERLGKKPTVESMLRKRPRRSVGGAGSVLVRPRPAPWCAAAGIGPVRPAGPGSSPQQAVPGNAPKKKGHPLG
ncbi:hypothetical protein LBMAG41_06580 [Cyanobium sp.]|nr:hypothetical protein LBMAG41_06580 [Cyanobium sp.]